MLANSIINGDRILLRPVKYEDAQDMYEYASDPATAYYVFPVNQTIEDTQKNILTIFLADPLGKYGIELKRQRKLIGTIYFLHINFNDNNASIGYVLNKKFEGHGYMTESLKMMLNLGFNTVGFERLYAIHDVKNRKSEAVMLRAHMKKEGVLRHEKRLNGKYSDMCCHSLLKSEYFSKELNV